VRGFAFWMPLGGFVLVEVEMGRCSRDMWCLVGYVRVVGRALATSVFTADVTILLNTYSRSDYIVELILIEKANTRVTINNGTMHLNFPSQVSTFVDEDYSPLIGTQPSAICMSKHSLFYQLYRYSSSYHNSQAIHRRLP
jgi:hypothetical protein